MGYERDLKVQDIGMERADEIEGAEWDCKRPPCDLKEGIAELDGDVCAPYWQPMADRPEEIRELDGTEISPRVDERAVEEPSNVQVKTRANGEE